MKKRYLNTFRLADWVRQVRPVRSIFILPMIQKNQPIHRATGPTNTASNFYAKHPQFLMRWKSMIEKSRLIWWVPCIAQLDYLRNFLLCPTGHGLLSIRCLKALGGPGRASESLGWSGKARMHQKTRVKIRNWFVGRVEKNWKFLTSEKNP